MKRSCRVIFAMMIAVFCSLLWMLPAACAAGATSVWVNGVELNAGNPYWKNGNLPASATDNNAYFDAATSTLTLNNATINTPHAAVSLQNLVYANGDLNLVLTGTSTLQYTSDTWNHYVGINADGLLTIAGSGVANILFNSIIANVYFYGTLSDGLTIGSGTLNVQINSVSFTYGIASFYDISISGGNMTISCNSLNCNTVYSQSGDFSMTGGKITVTAIATAGSTGVKADNITLEGGEGVISGNASSPRTGAYLSGTALSVSGGHFVFSGVYDALFSPTVPLTVNLTNVLTYVSTSISGSGKSLWTSSADGLLVSNYGESSPFHYVEFILPDTGDVYPQTGDGRTPWLWAGIALLGLLGLLGARRIAQGKRG